MTSGLPTAVVHESFKQGDYIWVATAAGICRFSESKMNLRKAAPLTYIKGVKVNGVDTSYINKLILASDHNNVEIFFVGLAFHSLGETTYRYRLIGLDSTWKTTSLQRIQYLALPPGDYRFEVQTLSGDLANDSSIKTFVFSIEKPLTRQSWFIGLEIILGIILLYITFLYIHRYVKRTENRKTAIKVRLAEAEQKALRSQMNPHFIFNALTTVQRFIIKNDKKDAYNYLEKFGSLIRRILIQSRDQTIQVNDELETLELYLNLESKRFSDKFTYEIKVDNDIDRYDLKIPPMLIQPHLENAINHGLFPKKSKGHLTLTITAEKGNLKCIIEDNGVGRNSAKTSQQGPAIKKHISLGSSITSDRMELMNEINEGDYFSEIIDLKDNNQNPIGTRVILTIPLISEF
jgi:hypothetical protein